MATIPKPSPPRCLEPSETAVKLAWDAVDGATGYRILSKEFPQEWSAAKTHEYGAEVRASTARSWSRLQIICVRNAFAPFVCPV